jgi:hypothetical protein
MRSRVGCTPGVQELVVEGEDVDRVRFRQRLFLVLTSSVIPPDTPDLSAYIPLQPSAELLILMHIGGTALED